jgi:cytochrome b involved in lipid metabolism
MSASITAKEVKDHATPDNGLYIIIDNAVYSMAEFADEHPGGAKILKRVGGKGNNSMLSFPINPFYNMGERGDCD